MGMESSGRAWVVGGRYRLVEVLDYEAGATIYRAEPVNGGAEVELRMFGPTAHPSQAQRLHNRLAPLRALRHGRCVDVGIADNQQLFMVTERVEGLPLRSRLEAGPLSEAETLELLLGVFEVLQSAHEAGVLHGALSPAHICRDEASGCYRVARLGMRRLADFEGRRPAGETVGEIGYLPPEALRGAPLDDRSDLYAMGVIAHEALTGGLPSSVARPLSEVSPGLRALIESLLAAAPSKRPTTAEQVLERLRALQVPRRGALVSTWRRWVSAADALSHGPLERLTGFFRSFRSDGR